MKRMTILLLATTTTALLLSLGSASAQPRRGAGKGLGVAVSPSPTAQGALVQALTGPDGEYAALAEYAAIVQKYGQIQPYASILRCEERHVSALKRHFELRGLIIPENDYVGKVQAPASLPEAAAAGITAEARNVTMYDTLLAQVKDQPDLVQVFTHLQTASRDHHLVTLKTASTQGGQLEANAFGCGMGGGKGACGMGAGKGNCGMGRGARQGQSGRPAWAGQGCGQNESCAMGLTTGPARQPGTTTLPGRGYRYGATARSQAQ